MDFRSRTFRKKKQNRLFQELNPRSTGYGNAGSLPLDVAHTATHEEERVSKASLSLGCAFLKSIAHWHPGEVESPVRLPQSLWPYQKNGFLWHEVVLALIMLHHYCSQNLLLNFSDVWSPDLHLLTVVNCCFGGRKRAWPCLCLCVITLTNRYVAWCLCGGFFFSSLEVLYITFSLCLIAEKYQSVDLERAVHLKSMEWVSCCF